MRFLGDITKIDGSKIEPVDVITGGSPCQDLSVAGKRAGLAGERSGLFMEQIRVVKEMRSVERYIQGSDKPVRFPRYLVWENVPGAFSSNFKDGFGDFGAVLEEIVRISEPEFSLPRLPEKQKWAKAGAICGDGWSLAWRTHDAQFWGVPQRRKRVSVVADFDGQSAGDVLFERIGRTEQNCGNETLTGAGGNCGREIQTLETSVSRNHESCCETRERTAERTSGRFERTGGDDGKLFVGVIPSDLRDSESATPKTMQLRHTGSDTHGGVSEH